MIGWVERGRRNCELKGTPRLLIPMRQQLEGDITGALGQIEFQASNVLFKARQNKEISEVH